MNLCFEIGQMKFRYIAMIDKPSTPSNASQSFVEFRQWGKTFNDVSHFQRSHCATKLSCVPAKTLQKICKNKFASYNILDA